MANELKKISTLVTNNNRYDSIQNQSSTIHSKVDLNIDGYSRKNRNAFEIYDKSAVANQVKLWLMSEPDDLIREGYGSNYKYTLFNIIGQRMNQNTLNEISNNLKEEFNNRGYSTDLEMIYLELKPEYSTHTITVDFVVKSKNTNQMTGSTVTLKE